MLRYRVIPTLLLQDSGLIKTTQFGNPVYVGDPLNAIRIFNEKEVDELIVLDISASKKNSPPNYSLIEEIAGECFMPLTYGGGIKNLNQAKQIFSLGVEKISIQSAALENTRIVSEISDHFGSQAVLVSIDIKRNLMRKPQLFSSIGLKITQQNWLKALDQLTHAGAGEILLNSVDKDGTLSGPDLEIIDLASRRVTVPLIALGGISCLHDIKECVAKGANAVAAGAFFVFHGPHKAVLITYPKYQDLIDLFDGDIEKNNYEKV